MTNDSFSRQMYFPTMIFTIEYSDEENLNAYLLDLIFLLRTVFLFKSVNSSLETFSYSNRSNSSSIAANVEMRWVTASGLRPR